MFFVQSLALAIVHLCGVVVPCIVVSDVQLYTLFDDLLYNQFNVLNFVLYVAIIVFVWVVWEVANAFQFSTKSPISLALFFWSGSSCMILTHG
jgi:hypothetical protein